MVSLFMCYYGISMNRDNIIEKIKLNKRYINNEDLIDSFADLAMERLDGVVDSIRDEVVVNNFIDKTIKKTILDVLKQNNRYNVKPINKLQKVDYKMFNFDNTVHNTPSIPVSQLKQLYSMLKKSDENNETAFLDVVTFRYKEKKNIKELSETMNMSEDEIVDILFEMSGFANKVAKI